MISPLRRVTVPVAAGTMEHTIGYHQQVLGMRVFYDKVHDSPEFAALVGFKQMLLRIVVMQQGDSTTGMVGLIEYLNPRLNVPTFGRKEGSAYPLYMVFSAHNVEAIRARAEAFGARVPKGPVLTHYPKRSPVENMTSFGPTGIWTCTTDFEPGSSGETKVGPLRRVAVAVAKGRLEAAVKFYRDVLGMEPYYEAELQSKAEHSTLDVGDSRTHLISMRQGQSTEGMVGFMEYLEPPLDIRPFEKPADGPYPVAFVFTTDEMDEVLDRIRAAGAPVVCPPLVRGLVREMTCLDPNGVLVNLVEPVH